MVLTDTDALKNGQTSERVGILKYHYYFTLAMNMQLQTRKQTKNKKRMTRPKMDEQKKMPISAARQPAFLKSRA
jgi:hypothetical protein